MSKKLLQVLLIAAVVLIAGCSSQNPTSVKTKTAAGSSGSSGAVPTSPVVVKDQPIKAGAVTIQSISSSGA